MKTKDDRQNDRRKSGHNCISEQQFGDILDVLRANRAFGSPVREAAELAVGPDLQCQPRGSALHRSAACGGTRRAQAAHAGCSAVL